MKKLLILLIAVSIIISMSGCKQEVKKTSNNENRIEIDANDKAATIQKTVENKIITIGWEYYMFVNKDSDIPNTIVYLSVQGKDVNQYKIGTFTGDLYDVTKKDCTWELPDNSIINCFGWYGGAGDILGVVRSGSNKLVVKHKFIEEAGGDEKVANEILKTKYEEILAIDIDENTEIKTVEGIKLDNNYEDK